MWRTAHGSVLPYSRFSHTSPVMWLDFNSNGGWLPWFRPVCAPLLLSPCFDAITEWDAWTIWRGGGEIRNAAAVLPQWMDHLIGWLVDCLIDWLIDRSTYDAKLQAQATMTYPLQQSGPACSFYPPESVEFFVPLVFFILGCWKLSGMSFKQGKVWTRECHCPADRISITLIRFSQSISPMP